MRKRKVKKWVRGARNLSNAARKIRLLFSKEAESSKTNTLRAFGQTAERRTYKKLNLVSLFIQARMKYKRAAGIYFALQLEIQNLRAISLEILITE